jgi:hypothetical protein
MISTELDDCFKMLLKENGKFKGSLPNTFTAREFIEEILSMAPFDVATHVDEDAAQ